MADMPWGAYWGVILDRYVKLLRGPEVSAERRRCALTGDLGAHSMRR